MGTNSKTVELILGNISFEDGKAIVHVHGGEPHGTLHCEDEETAAALGEILCNDFLAYLIPSVFKGEIIYEK